MTVATTTYCLVGLHLPEVADQASGTRQLRDHFLSTLAIKSWELQPGTTSCLCDHVLIFGLQYSHQNIPDTALLAHFETVLQPQSCGFHLSTLEGAMEAIETAVHASARPEERFTAVALKMRPVPLPTWEWVLARSRSKIVFSNLCVSVTTECGSKAAILSMHSRSLFHGGVTSGSSSVNLPEAGWGSSSVELPSISGDLEYIRRSSVSALLWEHHTLSDDKLLGSILIRLTGISDAPIPSGFESEVVRGGFVVGRLTGEFQVS